MDLLGVRISDMRPGGLVLGLLVVAARLNAQAPPSAPAPYTPDASASPSVAPAPYTPNASASPESALPSTAEMLENVGKLVKDGHLSVEADLLQASMPVIPKYTLDVEGSPTTSVLVQAADGKVTHMKFGVANGKLVV